MQVFIPKRVESRHGDRTGRTLEEPRPVPDSSAAEVGVVWDDGETEDCLTDDLVFQGRAWVFRGRA
jgi:hypothetical protein